MSNYKIVYILGLIHSGSTLLDSLIGAHSHTIGVGELFQLPSYALVKRVRKGKTRLGNQCTCGAPTIWECDFWRAVNNVIKESTGRELHEIDVVSRDPDIFLWSNKVLFDAIATVSGADIIVDSSKHPNRFRRLRNSNFAPVIPIFLIRNPKGQVNSVRKRDPISASTAAWRYSRGMLNIIWTLRHIKALRVHYEMIASDPTNALRNIMERLGQSFEDDQLNWAEKERHNLAGNAMRVTRDSTISVDDAWQKDLGRFQAISVDALTWPIRILTNRSCELER